MPKILLRLRNNDLVSKILNHNSKLRLYRFLIRPVVTYGCETWTLLRKDEYDLRRYERKILRKIFGPVREQDGTYRILMNHELDRTDLVRCLGHVHRMND